MTTIQAILDAAKACTNGGDFDATVAVLHDAKSIDLPMPRDALAAGRAIDNRFDGTLSLLPAPAVAGGRPVVSPTGPIGRDHDDVRRFADAAAKGIRRARDAGAKRIALLVQAPPADPRHNHALRVAALGALGALWEPLEAREALGAKAAE